MVRLATACLLLSAISATHAQESLTNMDPLRLEFSFSQSTADAKQANNEIATKSSNRFATLTYYFKRQFFGEVGYGRPVLHSITLNNASVTSQAKESTALALYGLGFRSFRKGSSGEYLGVGIRYTTFDRANGSNSDSTQMLRLFTQKDTKQRYGVIELSRENGLAGEISKLGGRHVWFNDNGIGFGIQWALGIGREIDETGLETSYRSRDAGILVMYRPKLIDNGYIEEPLDESTENPFEESNDEDFVDTTEAPSCDPTADPSCESDENPFSETDENPFAETDENPFSETDENPFAETDENPFSESDENPFVETDENPFSESDENPFAETSEDPFCDPTKDPFCETTDDQQAE